MLLSTIAEGEVDTADIFLLLAVIIAVIAALLSIVTSPAARFASFAGWLALGCAAFGLLVL